MRWFWTESGSEPCTMPHSALSGLSGEASAGLRGTVVLLFEARLDEMVREGRGKEMEALLASITGPERAAGIARRAAGKRPARDDGVERYMVPVTDVMDILHSLLMASILCYRY